jgi:hypothetical protein
MQMAQDLNLTLLTHKQLHLLQSAIHHYQVHKESIPLDITTAINDGDTAMAAADVTNIISGLSSNWTDGPVVVEGVTSAQDRQISCTA